MSADNIDGCVHRVGGGDERNRDSSRNTTEPSGVKACAPRRNDPPHPPFGHLLPGGEKGTILAAAEREYPGGRAKRSPSPRRGEGRGEGAIAVVCSEESRKTSA
jgi:hypothetical protein